MNCAVRCGALHRSSCTLGTGRRHAEGIEAITQSRSHGPSALWHLQWSASNGICLRQGSCQAASHVDVLGRWCSCLQARGSCVLMSCLCAGGCVQAFPLCLTSITGSSALVTRHRRRPSAQHSLHGQQVGGSYCLAELVCVGVVAVPCLVLRPVSDAICCIEVVLSFLHLLVPYGDCQSSF